MKEMLKKAFRSALSLMLVACLILGMSANGLIVLAADGEENTNGNKTINYVSLGDSMANGYGFVGYNQTSNDRTVYDFMAGEGMYGEGAYPNQFEAYLEGKGYDVNHTKLATSAMLAEDLLYLLGGREEFDDGWAGYKDYVGTYTDEELMPYIQNAITEADIITMGIGNAAFGAFLLNRITDALGVFGATLEENEKLNFEDAIGVLELDEEQYALVMEIYNDLVAELVANVPAEIAEEYNLDQIVDLISYTVASYVVNYKLLVEKILEMNPDVEIILVGLLNTTYGMNVTDENGEVILPFGDVMDKLFNVLNGYMAGLPAALQAQGVAEEAKLYYAAQPNPKFICQEFENLLDNGWGDIQDDRLSGTTIRQRNIDAFNGDLAAMIGMAVTGAPLVPINLADVQAYEAIDFDALKAQVEAAGMGAYWSPWAAFYFNNYISDQQAAVDKILSVAIYLAIEEAVARSTNTMDIQLSGMLKIAGDLSTVFTALGTPPTDAPESTRTWLFNGLSTDEVKGMCKIYGLFKVGNGMSVHPTPEGHDEIAKSVIAAYENEWTVQKETLDNAIYLITTYYDEAYAYAYAEAVKAGYIEEAVAYIDALIAEIEALNLDEVEMTDAFRAEANALRAEILATLGAAKALLTEADVLDQASLNALLALLNKAGNAMWQLTAVLEQAAIDVNQLAIIPALKAAHDELMNEVLPAIDAALQKAVAEGTAWLMAKTSQALKDLAQAAYELALEAAPEIADAVYDYLYNNPEEVIAFFAEYGDEMLYLVGEYGDEVLMVVAYVAYSYGPEIAEFVIENHETILKAMINWLEVHGENTAALLQVYAEALGLCDAVREQIEILENAVIELNKQAEAQIAILEAEIAALKAQLENASAELKAEIEAKIAELEAQIEMLKAEVAAKIAEVKAAIAELEAALQAAIEKGLADMAALKEAIENLDEKVLELIAAAKKTAIEEIIAATENVQAALENLDATVEELAGEVYEELKDLLANAVDALIEATIEAAKKYAPEIADAIYNYLYNNPEEVIAFFTEYGDEMLALVEEYGDEALMVIGYFLYLYGEDIAEFVIENHEEILAGICAWIDVHGENTAALLQVYAETLGLCDAVRDQIADLEAKLEELQAELEELKAQLENAANELNEEILAQIEKVEQEIAKVEKALEELKEQLEELYNQIVEIAEAIKEVAEAIKNLNDIIEGKIEGSINEAIDNVQDALEHLADVLVAVEELVEQINEMIDELQEIGEKIDNAINEMIETVEEIKAAIEELNEKVEETIAKIEAAIEEIEKAADELIAEAETALEALKEMAEELKDAVNAAIEDLIAKVREAYENAIRADYEIDRKSYYVGIGDDSAVADGYVEKLAEALGMTERFNNLAQEGLTVEDAFALIQEEMAEIAKADLITIGFNNVAATTNMFNTIAGMGKVDTDWMGLLGAEYTTYVDEALAEINAKLLEEGLDEATAALLTEAVNAYAYTYASRELYYPELVNAIHEISPEALVVIVGTYNDLEGVVLDMGGTEIAVGEYVQYLIDAANLQNLIYAMLTENTIYVDAPAVDTLFEEAVAEGSINVVGPQTYIFALMMGYMNPSETGHEYIKDQILNALNVTRATKLGDVNHDGLVDVEDAMLIQQYDAFLVGEEDLDLSVADVSGDGVVDVEDAMLIQQYDAFIIDVFPAEEEA